MIHYHGTPLTPELAAAQVYPGRHAMVSFAHPRQLPLIADVCQSFSLDNGAFSAWRSGVPITDWDPFCAWVKEWESHPAFDWFLIPDVIDGSEEENDQLLQWFDGFSRDGVPIWHMHESLGRLTRLRDSFRRVAIGSSGEYAQLKTRRWWERMSEAMAVLCGAEGRPLTKIHGLRMLDPEVFTRFPFASADSTNVARNVSLDTRWKGTYAPMNEAVRGLVLADRIEAFQSASAWTADMEQQALLFSEVFA